MTKERYKDLMADGESKLTDAEIAQGWHFCWDWDGLLICPSDQEAEACNCFDRNLPKHLL